MSLVVLSRHGETEWNAEQRYTGWSDPPLNDRGRGQARCAGGLLADRRIKLDTAYTSSLRRARQTASIMAAAAGQETVPLVVDWRLNERHFGRLEGLTKAEISARWDRVERRRWRDDETAIPPPVHPDELTHPSHDPRYSHVPPRLLPGSESRRDTTSRVLQFWHECVIPDLRAGMAVLVVAHLGPLRALADHIRLLPPEQPPPTEWAHCEPLLCSLGARSCCPPIEGCGRLEPRAC